MYLYKNRLIFGFIKKVIGFVFKAIYAVLSFFNMQYAFLGAVLGAILFFTGALSNDTLFYAYIVLIGVLVLLGLFLCFIKLFGIGKKKKDKKGKDKKEKERSTEEKEEREENKDESYKDLYYKKDVENNNDEPVYKPVKGHSGYYMKEYADKYELFRLKNGVMEHIRTDYKK